MAKKFLYICAGLLCLMFTYLLGAHSAGAVKGVAVEGASLSLSGGALHYSAVVNRRFYVDGQSPAFAPIPGTDQVIATDPSFLVMLENGDVLQIQGSPIASWVKIGNAGPQ